MIRTKLLELRKHDLKSAEGVKAMADALLEIRSAIDELDREIVALIARRQTWVVRAGELKRGEEDDAVRAPARVEDVVMRVRKLAADTGASPEVVEAAYRAMISGFIDLELSVHAEASTPATPPPSPAARSRPRRTAAPARRPA